MSRGKARMSESPCSAKTCKDVVELHQSQSYKQWFLNLISLDLPKLYCIYRVMCIQDWYYTTTAHLTENI